MSAASPAQPQADPDLDERGRLEALYQGDILHYRARPATLQLTDFVWDLLRGAYPEADPQYAQFTIAPDEFFRRLTQVRRQVFAHPETRPLIRAVLDSLGVDLEQTWFDMLRVRAVNSGGHRRSEAAEAYVVHRDTWYANPAAQINWWTAVRDATREECFAFHPDWYTRPIRNSSERFSYQTWNALGGWQVPNPAKFYPTVEEPVTGQHLQIACRRGESLLFSGTHLHGTAPHDSGRTRFSVELRAVHLPDVARLRTLRNLDNRSRGTTLGDYVRASDFAPFSLAALGASGFAESAEPDSAAGC